MTQLPVFDHMAHMTPIQIGRRLQRNEDTRVSRDGHSVCFFCEENVLTMPRKYKVCFDCFPERTRNTAIQCATGAENDNICSYCGQWCRITDQWNIIELRVRVCRKCRARVSERIKRAGPKPQYRGWEKIHGKNWREITKRGNQTASYIRRMKGQTDGEFDL